MKTHFDDDEIDAEILPRPKRRPKAKDLAKRERILKQAAQRSFVLNNAGRRDSQALRDAVAAAIEHADPEEGITGAGIIAVLGWPCETELERDRQVKQIARAVDGLNLRWLEAHAGRKISKIRERGNEQGAGLRTVYRIVERPTPARAIRD